MNLVRLFVIFKSFCNFGGPCWPNDRMRVIGISTLASFLGDRWFLEDPKSCKDTLLESSLKNKDLERGVTSLKCQRSTGDVWHCQVPIFQDVPRWATAQQCTSISAVGVTSSSSCGYLISSTELMSEGSRGRATERPSGQYTSTLVATSFPGNTQRETPRLWNCSRILSDSSICPSFGRTLGPREPLHFNQSQAPLQRRQGSL